MPYDLSISFGIWSEVFLVCIFIIAAIRRTAFGRGVWARTLAVAGLVSRRPVLMIVLAAAIPIVIRLLLMVVVPVPKPYVMEEFNHLFLIDTFSNSRLANPVHPLAVLTQTYQQLQWPHFMSARPPLPPIFMYFGQMAFGSPFFGNLMAVGLTSAALCWMLLAWVPKRWAAIGSFMAITTFCLFGYWVNSYWAPATIVLGGAILMGLVPRIEAQPRLRWALLFVIALVLLFGTRPYENAVYAAPICLWLAVRFLRNQELRPKLGRAIVHVALPVTVGLIGILSAQVAYNIETTGNPLLMPYQIWRSSQDITPMFLWQPMAKHLTVDYTGAALFVSWNAQVVADITDGGLKAVTLLIARHAVTFRDLLGPFLFLPFICWSSRWLPRPHSTERAFEVFGAICVIMILLAMAWGPAGVVIKALVLYALYRRWQNKDERLPIIVLVAGLIGTSLPAFYMNVYFAAFTAPMLILVVKGLRNLSLWYRPFGQSLAGYMILGCALMPIGQAAVRAAGAAPWGPSLSHFDMVYPSPRQSVIDRLEELPGQHVVFVRPTIRTSTPIDPVWNAPDVDTQKIVWLRDLRPEWVATAQQYYRGRRFWLMRVNSSGIYDLKPYPSEVLPPPVPLESLPNRDRDAARALGAKPS